MGTQLHNYGTKKKQHNYKFNILYKRFVFNVASSGCVKRLYVRFIIVVLFLFYPVVIKMCANFFFEQEREREREKEREREREREIERERERETGRQNRIRE